MSEFGDETGVEGSSATKSTRTMSARSYACPNLRPSTWHWNASRSLTGLGHTLRSSPSRVSDENARIGQPLQLPL